MRCKYLSNEYLGGRVVSGDGLFEETLNKKIKRVKDLGALLDRVKQTKSRMTNQMDPEYLQHQKIA